MKNQYDSKKWTNFENTHSWKFIKKNNFEMKNQYMTQKKKSLSKILINFIKI